MKLYCEQCGAELCVEDIACDHLFFSESCMNESHINFCPEEVVIISEKL